MCGPLKPHEHNGSRARSPTESVWNIDFVGVPVIGSDGGDVSSIVKSGYGPISKLGTPLNALASELPSIIITTPAGTSLDRKTGMSNFGEASNEIASACVGCVTIVGSRPPPAVTKAVINCFKSPSSAARPPPAVAINPATP